MARKLRPYQVDALAGIRGTLETKASCVCVLPTGTGKTSVAATLMNEWPGGNCLFLAHTRELVDQAAGRLAGELGYPPVVEMGLRGGDIGMFYQGGMVVVGSVQSMNTDRRLAKYQRHPFDLIVVDECHRAVSMSYRKIVDYFTERNKSCKVVGLTATPNRADGVALGLAFEAVGYAMDIPDAIDGGWLVPVRQRAVVVSDVEITGPNKTNEVGEKDFTDSAVESVMIDEAALAATADPLVREANGRPTIVFCATVRHAHELAATIDRYSPGSAAAVDGETPLEQRAELVAKFQRGDIQFLCNAQLFVEGFDAPTCSCVAVARPTKSTGRYTQMVGRGLRPLPGVVDGPGDAQDRHISIMASDKPDCVAEGTRVLTDSGLVPIERVTTDMKVWDGVEYVRHCGTILRGVRKVITYAGLTATEDHNVWTIFGWRRLGECAVYGFEVATTGDGGAPVREAEGRFRGGHPARQEGDAAPLGRVRDVRGASSQGPEQSSVGQGGLPEVRQPSDRPSLASDAGHVREAAMQQPEGSGVGTLRGKGDSLQLRDPVGDGRLGSGEPGVAEGLGVGPDRQRRPLRAGEPPLPHPEPEPVEHPQDADERGHARLPAGAPTHPLRGRDAEEAAPLGHDVAGGDRPVRGEVQQTEGRVWDILNAGPRHRFTAEGLLVHNCLVLDFVNAGAAGLVTVDDILGGDYDAEVRELAIRERADGDTSVSESLKRARFLIALEREMAARADNRASVAYEVHDRDGRLVAGAAVKGQRRGTITDGQLGFLTALGCDPEAAVGYSTRQAAAVIDSMKATRCTDKQRKVLSRAGIDPAGIGCDRASRIIDALKANGWTRPEVLPE